MAKTKAHSLPRDQFLTVAVNLLHKVFIEAGRTDAKNLYRALAEGKRVALTNLKMEDGSSVRFDLNLDHSEFDGSLNYGAFRASLRALLGNLAHALQEEKEIQTFTADGGKTQTIFGVTGVTVEEDTPAVMVLAADSSDSQPAVLLQLMYLDHTQFAEAPAKASETS